MAILETGHAVHVSTVQSWLAQPSRLAKTLRISLPKKEIGDDTAALLSTLTLQCCNLQILQHFAYIRGMWMKTSSYPETALKTMQVA
ncbi:unnamed protein product [Symbiodinium natans]|uniref:Uncharacterized protein n=1 Tax=Symbiodinium natans TaxID=878477 RepID=A0A812LCT5_9DINO|nr:unnamed protein product [Symbiodinium natans]